jgi:hypothetical protein
MFKWLQHLLGPVIPDGVLLQQRYLSLQADLKELRTADIWMIAWLDTNKESPRFQEVAALKGTIDERVAELGEISDQLGDALQKLEFESARKRLLRKGLQESIREERVEYGN